MYLPIRLIIADDHEVYRDGLKTLLEKARDHQLQVVGEAANVGIQCLWPLGLSAVHGSHSTCPLPAGRCTVPYPPVTRRPSRAFPPHTPRLAPPIEQWQRPRRLMLEGVPEIQIV